MPTHHPALTAWLRSHHGVVSRRRLISLGITPDQLAAMLRCGELLPVWEGVYRHAVWPDTLLSSCAALCAADPTLVICCGGAARIWRYRRCTALDVHVTGTGTGLRISGGPLHHRCPLMPPHHVHERTDGIRLTSPARTVFDLAKHLSPGNLESVIEQGLRRSQFDIPTLYGVGALLCRRGRAGSANFAHVLSSRPLLDSTYDLQRDRQARLVGARIERVSTDEIDQLPNSLIASLVAAYHQQRTLSLSKG